MDKPVIDIRTLTMYWTCGVCHKTFAPQMVVAVFEKFTNQLTGLEDLRVKHFQCLHHTENK